MEKFWKVPEETICSANYTNTFSASLAPLAESLYSPSGHWQDLRLLSPFTDLHPSCFIRRCFTHMLGAGATPLRLPASLFGDGPEADGQSIGGRGSLLRRENRAWLSREPFAGRKDGRSWVRSGCHFCCGFRVAHHVPTCGGCRQTVEKAGCLNSRTTRDPS